MFKVEPKPRPAPLWIKLFFLAALIAIGVALGLLNPDGALTIGAMTTAFVAIYAIWLLPREHG
jgi:hypothetical protein